MPQTEVLPCARGLQPLHSVHGHVAAHRAGVGCKVKRFVQQFSREKVRGKKQLWEHQHRFPCGGCGGLPRVQLAPFLAYLTHKLSFLFYSYLPALTAQCERVVLPGPLSPGFMASLHRFNEHFLPEACPEEGQCCAC